MNKRWSYSLIPVACIALGACDMLKGGGKEPTGQVVATVDGDEITLTELRAEMAGVSAPDPKARKALEQQALEAIINRKLIAKVAVEQKLDKTPQFAVQERRAMDSLQAEALQKKIIDAVPAVTREEAMKYMADNPHVFAERKIFVLDQIRMATPRDPKIMDDFRPLKTFEEVEAMLRVKSIPFQRGTAPLDAVQVNPKLVATIVGLPPGEVFVVPAGQMVLISRVRETRVQPFTGDPAVKQATAMVKTQRTQEALSRQFASIVKAGAADVKYNAQYKPAPPAKAPATKAAPETKG
jgi:EpsD family peptidyl-prolyl cis-trans isomerase